MRFAHEIRFEDLKDRGIDAVVMRTVPVSSAKGRGCAAGLEISGCALADELRDALLLTLNGWLRGDERLAVDGDAILVSPILSQQRAESLAVYLAAWVRLVTHAEAHAEAGDAAFEAASVPQTRSLERVRARRSAAVAA